MLFCALLARIFCTVRTCMSRRDIDSRGAFLEPECCGCLPLKWMQNWFHASTHCSSPWIDRWWLSLVCAEGDYIDLCCIVTQWCVQVSVQVYLHVCVHRRVHVSTSLSKFVSLETNLSKTWKRQSLLLHPINFFARGIHGNWKSKSMAWGLQRI